MKELTMTDKEVIETRNDLEMMKRPHLWPNMFLPLINRSMKTDSPFGVEGLLFANNEGSYIFIAGQNMFLPIPKDTKREQGSIEMLARLVNEGWKVD
jgi:hypothetical protein